MILSNLAKRIKKTILGRDPQGTIQEGCLEYLS